MDEYRGNIRSGVDLLFRDPVVFCEPLSHLLGREEFLRHFVRNLEAELVFYRHDQLNVIEGVEAEVVHEVRLIGELEKELVRDISCNRT